jgi:hypothetical protein
LSGTAAPVCFGVCRDRQKAKFKSFKSSHLNIKQSKYSFAMVMSAATLLQGLEIQIIEAKDKREVI